MYLSYETADLPNNKYPRDVTAPGPAQLLGVASSHKATRVPSEAEKVPPPPKKADVPDSPKK